MAGETTLTYGVGYRFDGAKLRDKDGYFDSDFLRATYYSPTDLWTIVPFYGSSRDGFAVLAHSTVRSDDTAEWGYSSVAGYGIQPPIGLPTAAELKALDELLSGLRVAYPQLFEVEPELGVVISLTADI